MHITSGKLPHISRLFTAPILLSAYFWSVRIFLWIALLALGIINITTHTRFTAPPPPTVLGILTQPLSPHTHEQLADDYWRAGLQDFAKSEASLAVTLKGKSADTILGVHTRNDDQQTIWKTKPEFYRQTLAFWDRVISTKPDYRDAYIQAAEAALQLENLDVAKARLNAAQILDPNFSTTQQLMSVADVIEME